MARRDRAMADSTHRRQDTVSSPLGVCVFDGGICVYKHVCTTAHPEEFSATKQPGLSKQRTIERNFSRRFFTTGAFVALHVTGQA